MPKKDNDAPASIPSESSDNPAVLAGMAPDPIEAKPLPPPTPPKPTPPPTPTAIPSPIPTTMPDSKPSEPSQSPTTSPSNVSDAASQLANESLIKMIDDKLATVDSNEFLVIKISKQGLLILFGLLLLGIGIFQIAPWIGSRISSVHFSLPQLPSPLKKEVVPEATISGNALPTEALSPFAESRIQVRLGSNSLELATTVERLLTTAGFSAIETIYDARINAESVFIVTASESADISKQITAALVNDFRISSDSATVARDNDVTAVILVGKNATLKK